MDKLNTEITRLFKDFEKNPPIKSEAIQKILKEINLELPSDYIDIFLFMNGGEGFLGDNYCRLYPLDKLVSLNQTLSVKEFAPEIFIFGSNGNGEAFAFEMISSSLSFIKIPFIPMDTKYANFLGKTTKEFIENLGGNTNKPSTQINRALIGKEIHEIQPIIFGGDPLDPKNKALVPIGEYTKLILFWNKIWRRRKEGLAK